MFTKNSPIGVIDSGISVARKVQKLLPHEDILYFGDGANTPYGNHTSEEILTMTRYMLRFMEEKQVKALLVACNTISCLIDRYRDDMSCPVFSVVQAGADAVRERDLDRVGVISTCFTANSKCYPELIGKSSPRTQVFSQGCPDLANTVERCVGHPECQEQIDATIRREVGELMEQGEIRFCVLGCTHYPLVEDDILRLFPGLTLIDPAEQMAKSAGEYLAEKGLANDPGHEGRLDIFTTGSVEEYVTKARKVGLNPVTSVQPYPPMER